MESAIAVERKSVPVTAILWVLKLGIVGMFVMAGYAKLSGAAQMVGIFKAIGLGQWFRYFTGATEVVSAALLLVPGLAAFGAFLAASTMIGALITHLLVLGGNPAPAIALLIASLIVLYSERKRILALLGR